MPKSPSPKPAKARRLKSRLDTLICFMTPSISPSSSLLSVSHLCKSVQDASGTLTILRDIDFTLRQGETAAIVGASGSGKSTLLSIMAGLDTPTQGTVTVAGQDIFALDEDQRAVLRARQMGFVFQSFQLLSRTSAIENVLLPLEYAQHPIDRREARLRAQALLERVGLGDRLDHEPSQLSGGQQQRAGIARSLVNNPYFILADEPTGNLDTKSADAVFAMMRRINREQGTSILFVTHNPELAARCDPIALTRLLRSLGESLRLAEHPLNARLFAEDLFIRYREVFVEKPKFHAR